MKRRGPHPLAVSYSESYRLRASINFVVLSCACVRGVDVARIVRCRGGFRVRCKIRWWWWIFLGIRHLVVRQRVKRCLAGVFLKWPDPGVVSVWVL